VKELTIPENFKGLEKDLGVMHNVKKISFGDSVSVVI